MMRAVIGSQHNSFLPIWVGNGCDLNGIGVGTLSLNESECEDLLSLFEPSISKLCKNRSLLHTLIQQACYLIIFDVSRQTWKFGLEWIPAHAHQILLCTRGLKVRGNAHTFIPDKLHPLSTQPGRNIKCWLHTHQLSSSQL